MLVVCVCVCVCVYVHVCAFTIQESKHRKTARGLFFVIKKKDSGPYWPRLQKDNRKVCVCVHVCVRASASVCEQV